MIGLGLSLVGGDIAQASSQFNRNIAPFSRIKSLSFDGTNDRAHFASDTELVEMFGTGDFSISYWAKGSHPTGNTRSLFMAITSIYLLEVGLCKFKLDNSRSNCNNAGDLTFAHTILIRLYSS